MTKKNVSASALGRHAPMGSRVEELDARDREALSLGHRELVIRRRSPMKDPMWLHEATAAYKTLGDCLFLMGDHGPAYTIPAEIREYAESRARRFLAATVGKPGPRQLQQLLWLVDAASRRDPMFGPNFDAIGHSTAVAGMFAIVDVRLARALTEQDARLAELIERWPDTTPRPPSKWEIVAKLWESISGETRDRDSIRVAWHAAQRRRNQKYTSDQP